MKRGSSLLLALVLIVSAAASSPARQVAGGYASASADDAQVLAAARFAVRAAKRRRGARVQLVAVERAETQVVAGINYRLCLRVREGKRTHEAGAVVYENLRRRLSLTEFNPGGCHD
jgi:hypothetical protein